MPSALEEMQRQQLALFDQAVKMFNPAIKTGAKEPEAPPPPPPKSDEEITDLRQRIAALQEAVESLAKKDER